jgi:uncharacterized membrane protein HdeD (DUF308 family)
MANASNKPSWVTLECVLLLALGVMAICLPIMAGIAVALLIAWVLVVAGLIGLASAFRNRGESHTAWRYASAGVTLVVGVILVMQPLVGTMTLSLVIAAYLLFDAVTQFGIARDHRRLASRSWGWRLAAGVLDVVLAVFIIFMSAIGAAVLIGLVVGIDLIAAGVTLLMIERGARRIQIAGA